MLARIHALNTDSSEESDTDDSDKELTLTKEALEELAIKEYNRALNLQAAGKTEISERLMRELLETEILIEAVKPSIPDSIDRPILKVKYCLHRNLALSADSRGEYDTALQHYCLACDLDGTNCYIWYRLGKLAMKVTRFDLAKHAFDQGLGCNPNHWPCMDSLIRLLYAMGHMDYCLHYIEIALKKEPNYLRGQYLKDLIFEERPFLKDFYHKFQFPESTYESEDVTKFLKDVRDLSERWCLEYEDDRLSKEITIIPAFGGDELSWTSLGKVLLNVYAFMIDNKMSIVQSINLNEILSEKILPKSDDEQDDTMEDDCTKHVNYALESIVLQNIEALKKQYDAADILDQANGLASTNINEQLSDENANSSDKQTSTDISDSNERDGKELDGDKKDSMKTDFLKVYVKTSKKRRGSDLTLLEQWGRSKQRRSSRKKNGDKDCAKQFGDETIEETLKRILPLSLLPEGLKIWKTKRIELDINSEDSMNTMDLYELFESNEKNKTSCNSWSIKNNSRARTPTFEELETFVEAEKISVLKFVNKYKTQRRDIADIMRDWLLCLVRLENLVWPKELAEVYIDVYLRFREVYAEHPWIFSDDKNLLAEDAEITLMFAEFYLDLRIWIENENLQSKQSANNKRIFAEDQSHLDWLSWREDLFSDNFLNQYMRIQWLKFQYLLTQKRSHEAIECLQCIIGRLNWDEQKDFELCLLNCKINNVISLNTAEALLKKLERMESLYSIEELYENRQYDKIAEILFDSLMSEDNLINSEDLSHNLEDRTFPRPTLLHILIESLWATENYKDCLNCSVSCLNECCQKYFLGTFSSISPQWASTIQRILLYLEALMKLEEPTTAIKCLSHEKIVMLVHCLCNIVCHKLNEKSMKIYQNISEIDTVLPWILLYHVVYYEESRTRHNHDNSINNISRFSPGFSKLIVEHHQTRSELCEDIDQSALPNSELNEFEENDLLCSIQILFSAHLYLGKRSLCMAENGTLLLFMLNELADRVKYNTLKDILRENLEQCCYCLYGHPALKKPRYISDHETSPISLKWEHAQKVYEIYRPEKLLEFDSRVPAINADTESLFQKIIAVNPTVQELQSLVTSMNNYIFGSQDEMPDQSYSLHSHISNIYYLLGDYYLKNREFTKAIKHYTMDVCLHPKRLDSWAGMALARAAQLDTKLNSCDKLKNETDFLDKAFATVRCFQHTMQIDDCHCVLLIEFGSFAYSVHSYCSRLLKQASETLSMEKFELLENRKDSMLNQAYECFSKAHATWENSNVFSDQDERWLYHYMLGKIAEKQKKEPQVYLSHYWEASRLLEENNACYPKKINYNSPQHLAVEALEVFYRLHASILKYLEHHAHTSVSREMGDLFMKHLIAASKGPFGNSVVSKAAAKTDVKESAMKNNDEAPVQNEILQNIKNKLETLPEVAEDCSPKKIPKTEEQIDATAQEDIKQINTSLEQSSGPGTPCFSSPSDVISSQVSSLFPEKLINQHENSPKQNQEVIVIGDSDEDSAVIAVQSNSKTSLSQISQQKEINVYNLSKQRPNENEVHSSEMCVDNEDTVGNDGTHTDNEKNIFMNNECEIENNAAKDDNIESLTIVDTQERLNILMKQCLEKMEFADENTDAESEYEPFTNKPEGVNSHEITNKDIKGTEIKSSDSKINAIKSQVEKSYESSSRRSSQETQISTTSSSTVKATSSSSTGDESSSSDDSSSSSGSSSSDDSSSDSSSGTSDATSRSSKVSKTSKSSAQSKSSKVSKTGTVKKNKSKKRNDTLSQNEIDKIVSLCMTSLEECVHRCPQHYKAFYRLGYHYLKHSNVGNVTRGSNLSGVLICRQLLLTTYNPGTDRSIPGLFSDKKSTNFFNGIWRLPASDVDRAGSFASHMSRCVLLLLEVLKESGDHKILLELCLQLQKTPDADKKYLRDPERVELSQQALTLCVQTLRSRLKKLSEAKINTDTIAFLLDVYRSYKKAQKHLMQKEKSFSALLVDTYKMYTAGREPDGSHLLDAAIRFCQQQLTAKKQRSQMPPCPTIPAPGVPQLMNSSVVNQFSINSMAQPSMSVPSSASSNLAMSTPLQQNSMMNTVQHAPKPRGRPPNNPASYLYTKNTADSNLSNMLINQYMSLISDQISAVNNMGLGQTPNTMQFNQYPYNASILNPSGNKQNAQSQNLNKVPGYNYYPYGNNNFGTDLNDMFKNFFQNHGPQLSATPNVAGPRFQNKYNSTGNGSMKNRVLSSGIRKPKQARTPKISQDFPMKSSSDVNKDSATISKVPYNKMAGPSANDKNLSTATITCTPISSLKEQPTKAHMQNLIPNMTIIPLQQHAHSNHNLNPDNMTGSMLKPPPPHVQTSPGKTLQQKLAEKKKNPNRMLSHQQSAPSLVAKSHSDITGLFKQGSLQITKRSKPISSNDKIKNQNQTMKYEDAKFQKQAKSIPGVSGLMYDSVSFGPTKSSSSVYKTFRNNLGNPYLADPGKAQFGYNKPQDSLTITATSSKVLTKSKSIDSALGVNSLDSLKHIANLSSSVTLTKANINNDKIVGHQTSIGSQKLNNSARDKMNTISTSVSVVQSKPANSDLANPAAKKEPDVILIEDD